MFEDRRGIGEHPLAPAFGQRDRENGNVDNRYYTQLCLVKMCVTIASTKYVSFQTRERPGSARGKLVGRSQYYIRVPGKYVCDNPVHKVRLVPDKG